ncbi:MAG: hypothetical protein IT440_01130 [Phycisphaeraceae bacterium]|nr:hypothetical protein [Phycisphaeraceae bacterium]
MTSEAIRVICPNLKCRAVLSAPQAARGKTVRCRMCGMKVRIPHIRSIAPSTTDASDAATSDTSKK